MSSADLIELPATQIPYTKLDGKEYLIMTKQAMKLAGRAESAYFPPQSSVTNVFSQETQVTFEVMPSVQTHIAEKMVLEMQVRNTSVSSMLLLPSFFLLRRIEIFSGSNLLDTIYPEHNYYESVLDNTYEYVAAHRGVWGIGADYGLTAATLAAGASRTLFVPIPSVITQSKVLLRALRTKLRVECHFAAGTSIYQNTSVASTGLVLDSINLRMDGFRFAGTTLDTLLKSYDRTAHVARGSVRRFEKLTAPSATAGVDTNLTLSSLNGTFSHMRFFVRPNGATRDDVIGGRQLNTFTILDSNGSPLSYQNISAEYNRLEMATGHVASDFYSKTGAQTFLYQYAFSDNPVSTITQGINGGELVLNSNYRLAVNVVASGNYEVFVMAYNWVNVVVEDGALALRIL